MGKELVLRDKKIVLNRPIIMGILNVTPDSFSDGGKFLDPGEAVRQGLKMIEDGADIIDIGGESTRPGALRVEIPDEIERVAPVIKALRAANKNIPLSIDTYKEKTALAALEAGADMVNDISGGVFEPAIMGAAAKAGAGYVIMHIQGTPGNMQENPVYSKEGVVSDIAGFFSVRIKAALKSGIKKENLVLDPGLGFGKTLKDNFEVISKLDSFKMFGLPVLTGASRKSMIGRVLNITPDKRVFGTAAAVALCVAKGSDMVRVHDVKEMKEVADMAYAMTKGTEE